MKYRTRIQYSDTQKAMMWDRWRRGESLHAIAQLFDRNHSSIGGILVENRRHPALATVSLGLGTEAVGTRGDLSRGGGRSVDAYDSSRTRAGTEHSEPRDRPQRRSVGIPRERGGCLGVAAGQAAEAL